MPPSIQLDSHRRGFMPLVGKAQPSGRYQMRQVFMPIGLFTHDVSFPVGQIASCIKFPTALVLPSDRDGA